MLGALREDPGPPPEALVKGRAMLLDRFEQALEEASTRARLLERWVGNLRRLR